MLLNTGRRQPASASLGLLPSGAAGTRATLRLMQQMVKRALRDEGQFAALRRLASTLTRRLQQKDRAGELLALFAFVRDRIRYLGDARGIETLQTPLETLQAAAGDCDDKAMLLSALAELIGYATRFVAVGMQPERFSHVYVEVKLRDRWVPMDTTEPQAAGWAPRAVSRMIEHV